ncbi:MAG: hypothetical protein CMH65_09770 [Nevskiales bacterium]|nr:hypothetical protein [Nevskiales bacterium]
MTLRVGIARLLTLQDVWLHFPKMRGLRDPPGRFSHDVPDKEIINLAWHDVLVTAWRPTMSTSTIHVRVDDETKAKNLCRGML